MTNRAGCRGPFVIAGVLLASAAQAADPKFQGIGEVGAGYLDTTQSPPDGGPGEVRAQRAVLTLSPGVIAAFWSPRSLQRIGYRFEYDFYFEATTTTSSSNRLEYLGFFDLSPRVGLVLDARVAETNHYSSLTFAPPGVDLIPPLPVGAGAFLGGGAGETFTFDVGEGWRAWQTGTIVAEVPIFDSVGTTTVAPGGRLGLERTFRTDAIGAEGRINYAILTDGIRADGTPAGVQRPLVTSGVGLWRRDWGLDFASRVEAGVLRLDLLNAGTGFWSPAVLASLAYVTPYGDAELSYSHTVRLDPVLGQTLLVHEVRLRGGLPLTRNGQFFVTGSAGYQRGLLVDETVDLSADVTSFIVDVMPAWQATPALALGIRYQHVDQDSDQNLPGLPLHFLQNGVLLTATYKLPPDPEMPRAYRAPRRVDGTDEIRDTVRPDKKGDREGGQSGGR